MILPNSDPMLIATEPPLNMILWSDLVFLLLCIVTILLIKLIYHYTLIGFNIRKYAIDVTIDVLFVIIFAGLNYLNNQAGWDSISVTLTILLIFYFFIKNKINAKLHLELPRFYLLIDILMLIVTYILAQFFLGRIFLI